MFKKIIFLSVLVSIGSPLQAHVSLEGKQTAIGASYKAIFRVPHGCDGKLTQKLQVNVPEGVIAVKPMPKAGWKLEKVQGSYEKHYTFHGSHLSEGVKEITWSGGMLADDEYDEFTMRVYISDDFKDGDVVYFPTVQECADGASTSWIEVPAKGQNAHDLPHPAPSVTLIKESQGHHHESHLP